MDDFFVGRVTVEEVETQLETTKERLAEDTIRLKEWFKEQPHLPQDAVDDNMLQKFVVGSKGNLDRAKGKLDAYFTLRNHMPELFANRDPKSPELMQSHESSCIVMLPGLTSDGCRVMLLRMNRTEIELYNAARALQRAFNVLDLWLASEPLAHRFIAVVDQTGVTLRHLLQNPLRVREGAYYLQKAYPLRMKAMILINSYQVLAVAVDKLFKPMLGKKLGDRVSCYTGDYSKLYDTVPRYLLPKDYGGEAPSVKELHDKWLEISIEKREWLTTAATVGSDETLRKPESKAPGTGCSLM